MRFTVKPSMYDSVPTALDRVDPTGDDGSGKTEEGAESRRRSNTDGQVIERSPLRAVTHDKCSSGFTLSSSPEDQEALLPSNAASFDHEDSKPIGDLSTAVDQVVQNSGPLSTRMQYDMTGEVLEIESKSESYVAGGTTTMLSGVSLATRGLKYAARQQRRLVYKDGNCNISSRNVMSRKRKYLVDIFTTLVDMRWRYNVILFTAAFVVSWLAFSVVWYLIAYVHGDTEHVDDDDWKSCAAHVYDYPTALLFSIETQTTIGYGYRVIEPNCVPSFILLMIQSCFGVFQQSLMTGLIFAKLSRPKQRAHTLLFSRNAVVCKRDMQYCLLFRVGDMRKSHIIGTSIRAVMVKDRLTKEGEVIPLCQSPLNVQTETCNASDNFVFLVWPVTVMHYINSSSPLWNVSADQLLAERFEIVVILEGVVESTGGTTQVRTSYLPSEILWGHRLAPLLTYQKENGQYRIDYSQFHAVEPIKMPECSAKQHADRQRHLADDDDDDEHPPYYFTAPAVKLSSSAGSGRLKVMRMMRGSLGRRRNRNRLETASTISAVAIDDVTKADRLDFYSDEENGQLKKNLSVDLPTGNGNANKFVRSISFA